MRSTTGILLQLVSTLALFVLLNGVSDASPQDPPDKTSSYWKNQGDFERTGSVSKDTGLGEFHPDIGGQVEFSRYDFTDPNTLIDHPYKALKSQIKANFFDLYGLDSVLSGVGGLDAPVYSPVGSGFYGPATNPPIDIWYLPPTAILHWEQGTINGGAILLRWVDIASPPPVRYLLLVFHSGGEPFIPKTFPPPDASQAPTNFVGEPFGPVEQALSQGHIVLDIYPNRRPDSWVALQRAQDMLRYLQLNRTQDLSFEFAVAHGGSVGSTQADIAALLGPKWCRGSTGGLFTDYAYTQLRGAWGKLMTLWAGAANMHGALIPIPPGKTYSWTLMNPSIVDVAELSDPVTGTGLDWEEGALSRLMRLSLPTQPGDQLKRPLHGIFGNVDVSDNIHWWIKSFKANSLTDEYRSLQLMAHGEVGQSDQNKMFYYDGTEFAALIADAIASGSQTNPAIKPGEPILNKDPHGDPFHINAYAHTLLTVPDNTTYKNGILNDLATMAPWFPQVQGEPQIDGPIGAGVAPGANDSLYAGDIDNDGKIEVVFGNYDGFLEIYEERLIGDPAYPILVREHRSEPLGYSVVALDVGELGKGLGVKKYIVCASSVGKVWGIPIHGPNSYGIASEFPKDPTKLYSGYIPWLAIGDFDYGSDGNELLVQDETFRWVLFDTTGTQMSTTNRRHDVASAYPNNYTGACGKPAVCYWPPRYPTSSEMAFAPGQNGRLYSIWYESGQLRTKVVSDDIQGAGRVAHFWDGSTKPHIIVGATRGNLSLGPLGYSLTIIDPTADAGSTIVAQTNFSETIDLQSPLAIEEFASNELLVAHFNHVTLVKLDPTTPGFGSYSSNPPPIVSQTIPGVDGSVNPPSQDVGFINTDSEIMGVACYTGEGNEKRVCISTPNGRLWLLDDQLEFTRQSNTLEFPTGTPLPWYANRSVAQETTISQVLSQSGVPIPNDEHLWIDEQQVDFRKNTLNRDVPRILSLDASTGTIDDYERDGFRAGLLYYRDMEVDVLPTPPHSITPYYFNEIGAMDRIGDNLYRYTMHIHPFDPTLQGETDPRGGYIFKIDESSVADRLETFNVPVDSAWHYNDSGSPWPYEDPSNRYKGQVTSQNPLPGLRNYGNSVWAGNFEYANSQNAPAVAVGTLGGFVYAVDPAAADPNGLQHWSADLGWGVVGLDAGDIDGDDITEIVAGVLMDAGTYEDYAVHQDSKVNRGQLFILNPSLNPPSPFDVQRIDLVLTGGPHLFNAGVTGVKIDDIDGDGSPEIWCGDALGYLYALQRQTTGDWKCVWRSVGLGCFPGNYNNIYPVKVGGTGPDAEATSHLIVVTPGYVYRLDVHYEEL